MQYQITTGASPSVCQVRVYQICCKQSHPFVSQLCAVHTHVIVYINHSNDYKQRIVTDNLKTVNHWKTQYCLHNLSRKPRAAIKMVSEWWSSDGGDLHHDYDPWHHRERVPRLPAAGQSHTPQQWVVYTGGWKQIWIRPKEGGSPLHAQTLGWWVKLYNFMFLHHHDWYNILYLAITCYNMLLHWYAAQNTSIYI